MRQRIATHTVRIQHIIEALVLIQAPTLIRILQLILITTEEHTLLLHRTTTGVAARREATVVIEAVVPPELLGTPEHRLEPEVRGAMEVAVARVCPEAEEVEVREAARLRGVGNSLPF